MPHSSPEKATAYRSSRYAALANDPIKLKEKRAAERARYHAKKTDPVWRARKNELERASRERRGPQRVRESCSASKRKTLYGVSRAEFDHMLAVQDGKCAICGGSNGDQKLAIDHDHASGRVRGLLCHNCNHAIGKMKDDPARLRRAAEYLERR